MSEIIENDTPRGSEVRYYKVAGNLMRLGLDGLNQVHQELEWIGRPVFDGGVESGGQEGEIVVLGDPLGDYERQRLHGRSALIREIPADRSFMHDDYLNPRH
jgi:hypothetical protein